MVVTLFVIFFVGMIVAIGLCYGTVLWFTRSKLLSSVVTLLASPVIGAIFWLWFGSIRSGLFPYEISGIHAQDMERGAYMGAFFGVYATIKGLVTPIPK